MKGLPRGLRSSRACWTRAGSSASTRCRPKELSPSGVTIVMSDRPVATRSGHCSTSTLPGLHPATMLTRQRRVEPGSMVAAVIENIGRLSERASVRLNVGGDDVGIPFLTKPMLDLWVHALHGSNPFL